jgi:hypothetical protein
VSANGDFATVIRRGDPVSGAILLVGLVRGKPAGIFERFPSLDGPPTWEPTGPSGIDSDQVLTDYLAKRSGYDPDLWVLELDVADAERLTRLLVPHD